MIGTISNVDSKNIAVTWSCFVDQIQIKSIPSTGWYNTNQVTLCQQSQMANGPHELTVNISAASTTLFNFDGISYYTSDATKLDHTVIMENTDQDVVFGSGWLASGPYANATATIGSKMTFSFNGQCLSSLEMRNVQLITRHGIGTGVTLKGVLPTSGSQFSATYSIDGSSPTAFTMTPHSFQNESYLYNQDFFTATDLSPETHTLEVVYTGSALLDAPTPLMVDKFFVTLPESTVSLSPSGTPSSTPSPPTPPVVKKTPMGAIVGGLVGGIVFLSLALLAFFLLRRRRYRREGLVRPVEDSRVQPSLNPFEYYSATDTTAFYPISGLHSATVTVPGRTARKGSGDSPLTSSAVMPQYATSGGRTTGTTDAEPRTQRILDMKSWQSMAVALGRPRRTQVMVHTDSGARMRVAAEEVEVVEMPPQYTTQ